jgi:vacuolar-type H+-ATPase subunit I/STV1
MQMQALQGYNADPDLSDNCANCIKQDTLFPMDTSRKFYKDVKKSQEDVITEVEDLSKTADIDTCEREIKQAKKDALQAALTAAEAAKLCEIKK